jgi:dCMP deaminase
MTELATKVAGLSTCKRLRVGAIIVDHKFTKVLSIGYNGQPAGRHNNDCTGVTPCGCVHAEANALIKLQQRTECMFLIATHTPCGHCEGLIINTGIKEVFAWEAYRIPPSLPVTIIGEHFEILKRWSSVP